MKLSIFNSSLAYALTILVGSVSSAHAAPGPIAQQPLFLQTSVPPNIFFLTDNSGSMKGELMTQDYSKVGNLTVKSDSLIFPGETILPPFVNTVGCPTDSSNNGGGQVGKKGTTPLRVYSRILQTEDDVNTCNIVAEEEWRARLYEYNTVYYNPNRVYLPWVGNNANGEPFKQATIKQAQINPNDPNSGTIDLTKDSAVLVDGERSYYSSDAWKSWCNGNCKGWRYYTWDDTNENGVIDDGELDVHWVKNLHPGTGNNPPVNNQKNFANWFSYHRSREFSAKYALSVAISEATRARIGYAAINHDNSIRIDAPNATSGDADTSTHKQDVLSKLFNSSSTDGTPLKGNLKAAGDYFKTGELKYFTPSVTPGEPGTFSASANNPSVTPVLPKDKGGACQSNNTILMTDGFYDSQSTNVGNADADNGKPYADGFSDTLADVAMYYYETDLATGIDDLDDAKLVSEKDYTPSVVDTALHQHMNTHTVAFGLHGDIDPKTVDINADGFSWKEPLESSAARIDDLFHAAVNGRGNYISAADPDELVKALVSTVNGITDTTQSATSVAMSAFQLKDDSLIFFSRFTPGDWSGELEANKLDFDEGNDNKLSLSFEWEAGEELADKNIADRTIYTYNNGGVTFEWDNISAEMKTALKQSDGNNVGKARLDFLRGATNADENLANTKFRKRKSILGDIINSSPVYVGAPSSPYPDKNPFGIDGKRYFDFWDANKERKKMLYVGANDGMLHGFNAKTGEEEIAYVPATIAANLHELTDPEYIHRFFVDATPTVGDAFYASDWHTVLVGTLGAGGQGLFALDITDPNHFITSMAADNVLWEFNSNDDADMGYSFSKPTIALMENNKWAVVVGNGYDSANGVATLFIIYLDADASNGWTEGTDYLKISTEVGTDKDKNGLSTPTVVDSNGDGYVDRVYAGDLKGNMWAFSLKGNNTSNWGVTYESNSTPQPLFQANNKAGDVQAITMKPSVIRHPQYPTITNDDLDKNSSPNLMVLFGTGQYVSMDDLDNTQTQSFYAVWDKGNEALSRSNLIEQTITSGQDNGISARVTTNKTVPYGDEDNSQRFGWFIDLDKDNASTGERVVSNAVVINDVVFFTTYIPNINPCGTGGESWFMFLNAVNGAYPDEPVISINGDSLVDKDDKVNLQNNNEEDATAPSGLKIEGTLGSPSLDMGDNDGNGTALFNTSEGVKALSTNIGGNRRNRLSWRELR